jgi:hypothetical protein
VQNYGSWADGHDGLNLVDGRGAPCGSTGR